MFIVHGANMVIYRCDNGNLVTAVVSHEANLF